MEREDSMKEDNENKKEASADTQHSSDSAVKASGEKNAADASDVVKDENIPVVYIDTTPDVPIK